MKALLVACLLLAPLRAEAFLFGKASEKKAAQLLSGLRAAHASGDCGAVLGGTEPFLAEKPARKMREEAYGYIGSCYELSGLTDKAVSHYRLALELFPGNAGFAMRLGTIYNSSGFHSQAAPLFAGALALDPADAMAAAGLARAYYGLGFLAKSREQYARAARLQNYTDSALLREYAGCLLKQRDWAGTETLVGKGAAAEPAAAFWPVAAGRALAGRGRYAEAAAALAAADRLEPAAQRRLERALYLLLGGRREDALAAAEAELASGGALAAAVKALALYSSGRAAEAEPWFRAAAQETDTFTGRLAAEFLSAAGREGGPCRK